MTNRPPSYRGYRFPPKIISRAVWLYHRFALSFRDVEDLLASQGVSVNYEAIRKWCRRFGPELVHLHLRCDDCGSCLSASAAVEIHTCRALGPVGQSCRLMSLTCRPQRPA